MSGMGERQMKILKALERKGYYALESWQDLTTCRKLYGNNPKIGMKRIYKGRWYLFTEEGLPQLLEKERVSKSYAERLKRYAEKMLAESVE